MGENQEEAVSSSQQEEVHTEKENIGESTTCVPSKQPSPQPDQKLILKDNKARINTPTTPPERAPMFPNLKPVMDVKLAQNLQINLTEENLASLNSLQKGKTSKEPLSHDVAPKLEKAADPSDRSALPKSEKPKPSEKALKADSRKEKPRAKITNENRNLCCYQEYIKLKKIHLIIQAELTNIQADSEAYEATLAIMNENKERHEDELGYYLGIEDNRKKRIRRLATEIERKHKCLVLKCPKAYGSEGSLNQHLLRKHPLVYKEWMKRISEKEAENSQKKNQISREEKQQIRNEIQKISATLWQDDESQYEDSELAME